MPCLVAGSKPASQLLLNINRQTYETPVIFCDSRGVSTATVAPQTEADSNSGHLRLQLRVHYEDSSMPTPNIFGVDSRFLWLSH